MAANDDEFSAALDFIDARSSSARGYITRPSSRLGDLELGLRRTRALLDALGAPDRTYPIVHIAGSKGKGSTGAFAASIATCNGYRTGLSTSPHLHSFRERIAIDGHPITRSDFARIARTVRTATETLEDACPDLGTVSAFELLTVMALLAFADAGCEVSVVEVGMGGTFDSTNVVTPTVSVITRLDLEHTQVLGETLAEIAKNKAGIIKPETPVVTARQDDTALAVIVRTASRLRAPLLIAGRDFSWSGNWREFVWNNDTRQIVGLRTGMPGDHQMENASLALAAWEVMACGGLDASDDAIRAGLEAASLPGRFERVEIDGRVWILDGAHTPVSAAALSEALLAEFGKPIGVIAGMLRDKHPYDFFHALAPAIETLIVTTPDSPRSIPAEELLLIAREANSQTIARKDLDTCLDAVRANLSPDVPIAITGSFALVAEARDRFGMAAYDR